VASESLHVTLCFLGWRGEDEVDAIAAACGIAAAEAASPLALGAAIWLPSRRPRVLAVELEDREAKLARAHAALSGALAAGGWYEPEVRPFLAHATVARVGTGGGSRARELPEPPHLEFLGSRVVLYRSRLSRSGARYEALAEVVLAGASAA
jgi:2'-5' RNA ligase